ncbi:MAG: aromatic hydrocarbon degradation protein [Chitinophagaceae bacterium]
MKKKILTGALSLFSISVFAQIPEDVLKYSWGPTNGTARSTAIGGAMGSLGGDLSATFNNPAGLAFYRTSDLVISPGFSFLKNKADFRGTSNSRKDSYFNLGTSGYVGGMPGRGAWVNKTFSFAVNRTANFSNKIRYGGQNDFSSYAEQFAAEAANSGQSIDEMLDDNSNVSLATKMALYSFLIDTASLGGQFPDFISMAMYDNLKGGNPLLLNQVHTIETSGGITELAIGYAANRNDRLYIGGSIGIPIVNYERRSTLREEDAVGNWDNFNFSELTERFTTKGFGVNAKLGMIVKAGAGLRLGLAIHTPTIYALTDSYEGSIAVDLDSFRTTTPGVVRVNSNMFNDNQRPEYDYDLNSPWKFTASGAYVINGVEDVRQQKGFITGEVEYVTYKSNKFRSADGTGEDYYQGVNTATKSLYRNAMNFRVGGEMKFNTFMGRLGFAYYGNPYSDEELKASKTYVSGGVGYRYAGFFVDFTYVYSLQKDVSFPYRLPDKANTFSNIKTTGSNVLLTFGVKI